MSDITKLNQLNNRARTISEERSELKGQKAQIEERLKEKMGLLKEQFGVTTLAKANALKDKLEKEIAEELGEIEKLVAKIEEQI